MTLEEAIADVERLLMQHWRDKKETSCCELYSWDRGSDRHPEIGFRISEVSFWTTTETGMGGCSFMQVDPGGGAEACFFAERAVLARVEEWEDEEIRFEDWRLIFTIFGEEEARSVGAEKGAAA